MAATYRYAGKFLAQKTRQAVGNYLFDPQQSHMGMLELDVDRFTAGITGAKEVLILSIQEFQIPARSVNKATLEYLNGNSHYPTRPQALADVTVTFRDFTVAPTRAILHKWFEFTFNERTGLMAPPSLLKTTGHLVLFGADGRHSRTAELRGVWIMDQPQVAIAMGRGEVLTMAIKLSVDCVLWDNSVLPLDPVQTSGQGAVSSS